MPDVDISGNAKLLETVASVLGEVKRGLMKDEDFHLRLNVTAKIRYTRNQFVLSIYSQQTDDIKPIYLSKNLELHDILRMMKEL